MDTVGSVDGRESRHLVVPQNSQPRGVGYILQFDLHRAVAQLSGVHPVVEQGAGVCWCFRCRLSLATLIF